MIMVFDDSSNVTSAETGKEMLVWDGGFFELDDVGKEAFRWRALDHVEVGESTDTHPEGTIGTEWDWL
jgi:hypothetical protein